MQLSTVTLEAKDLSSTVSYLSELLDLEIVALSDNEILLKNQKLEFKVVPGAKSRQRGNILFELSVNDREELLELYRKFQFLSYRFSELEPPKAKFSLEGEDPLELIDPDGRRWRFDVMH